MNLEFMETYNYDIIDMRFFSYELTWFEFILLYVITFFHIKCKIGKT